jgi:uncharacterized phage protein gp47/JayE
MGYVAPSVGPAGLTIPSYKDILADNLAQFKAIYGANQYVGTDSAIYQFLSVLSLKMSDACQGLQLLYNQSSPLTAVGAGLDRIVKLDGIARKPFTFSIVILTIVGTPGTVITNGVAQDGNGKQWLLPQPTVTIPGGGSIGVSASCTTPGNVTAEPNTITIIASPVGGWASVNNASAAIPGTPVETDSQLRARQAISVALPSQTRLAGTVADLLATPGVTRLNVLENPTGSVDSFGNPPHSITAVVDGTATQLAIATAIYNNRGIGCLTNGKVNGSPVGGTVVVNVTDPNTGYVLPISYLTPTYVPIYVTMNVHLLAGGTSATLAAIQAAVENYLNSLEIGEPIVYSELWGAALSARSNPDMPTFSIHSVFSDIVPAPTGTVDIAMLFYQVSQGILANVVINSV